ncbi:MAG TPA: thioredoxin fold domain-containing protein [Acidiferrobacter sp.]|nr:thioredoxin fold domain-containing protein [Acidiferrobacter sp.]
MKILRIMPALLLMTILGQGAYADTGSGPLWSGLQTAASISEGTGAKQLYIFFDPNCPYCHDLYQALQPLIGPDQLKIAWIPVGILALSSFGKAAHLLEDNDPMAALDRAERAFRHKSGELTPARATPAITRGLTNNVRLLAAAGADGVPFLVYKDQTGRVNTVMGDPPEEALRGIISHMQVSLNRH